AVVPPRRFRPRGRYSVEADILELSGLAAAGLELHRRLNLVDPPRIARLVEPGEEAGHRHAVAQMRLARALDLDRVLDGLGVGTRVGAGNELRAFGLEQL